MNQSRSERWRIDPGTRMTVNFHLCGSELSGPAPKEFSFDSQPEQEGPFFIFRTRPAIFKVPAESVIHLFDGPWFGPVKKISDR